MRNYLILFIFFSAFWSSGQGLETLRFPDMMLVYEVYDVRFALELPKKSTLVCVGCDTLRSLEAADMYVLRAKDSVTEIQLEIYSKKGVLLEQQSIPVLTLPDPRIYWGSAVNGDSLTSIPSRFTCKYDRSVPLNAIFAITHVEFCIEELKALQMSGSGLSEIDISRLEALPEGTKITVHLKVVGPDRKKRELSAVFYR